MYTATYSSPVGLLELKATDTHLYSLLFVEQDAVQADIQAPILDLCRQQLDEYFAGQRRSFELPVQQPGSVFQQQVWQLLQSIPFGRTLSYADLARQYGDLKAIRAIASANGRNKLSIFVPCHRVIGTDRSLTGYAGGLWRKQWLLEHEARYYGGVQQGKLEW